MNSNNDNTATEELSLATIAIAGRPNVGKSTLFNRLTGRKSAIVAAVAGVTRDTKLIPAEVDGIPFYLADTAGIETHGDSMAQRLNVLAEKAVSGADAILFMVDGKAGITPQDKELAVKIRAYNKPIVLVVNKIDVKIAQNTLFEAYELGLDTVIGISSEHGIGFDELGEEVKVVAKEKWEKLEQAKELNERKTLELAKQEEARKAELIESGELEEVSIVELSSEEIEANEEAARIEAERNHVIPLAIIGRPNAGKSTLINSMLNDNRMLTGDEAGLTRESVATKWDYKGQKFELVDTPGIRKQAKVTGNLEKMSVTNALGAMSKAEAVVLMMDATISFEKQDLIIASRALDAGKPLIVALNKWDKVEEKVELMKEIEYLLKIKLSQVKGIPVVPIIALKKDKRFNILMEQVMEIHKLWKTRISTAKLNRFLEGMVDGNPPPMCHGRMVKIKYMTQVASEPPTFAVWCNMENALENSYTRYLTNGLRSAFNLQGIVIKMLVKSSENPYN